MSSKTDGASNSQYRKRLQSVCILPLGYSLDVFEQRRSLALFEVTQTPQLVLLQELTRSEWLLFEKFLRSETFFCSHATLLSSIWSPLQEEVYHRMISQREWGSMVKSMKETLYRLKRKLQQFYLTIVAVIDKGYLLVPRP